MGRIQKGYDTATFQMQKKARNPLPGGKKRGKKEDTSMARELKFWKHLTNAH